jgi:hypothetical protein
MFNDHSFLVELEYVDPGIVLVTGPLMMATQDYVVPSAKALMKCTLIPGPPAGFAFLLRGTKEEARSAPRRCDPRCRRCQ